MKYKATEKNEYLFSGTEFEFKESSYVVAHYYDGCRADQELKNDWIENGLCEEIQEPEFTQREMKDRCVNFLQNHSGHSLNRSIEIYDNWIKGKE